MSRAAMHGIFARTGGKYRFYTLTSNHHQILRHHSQLNTNSTPVVTETDPSKKLTQNPAHVTSLNRGGLSLLQHRPVFTDARKLEAVLAGGGIVSGVGVRFLQQHRSMSIRTAETRVDGEKLPPAPPAANFDLVLDDCRTAFRDRTKWELIRALSIFWVCSFNFVADHSLKMMSTSQKLLGRRASEWLLKRWVYAHFVAGETREEVGAVVRRFQDMQVGPLLAAPMEDDIDVFHEDADQKCDRNLEMILGGVALAQDLDPQFPMVQLRISALMPGNFCAFLSGKQNTFGAGFPDSMRHHLEQGIARVAKVCQAVVSRRVMAMVDAEYTYLNPAISLFSLAMMCVCNLPRHAPLVFHTYQNYLKVREATPPLVFHTYQNYLKVREATPSLVFHTCHSYLKGGYAPSRLPHLSELLQGKGGHAPLVFHTYQNYLKVREAMPPLVFHIYQNYLKVREATPPIVFHTYQSYLKVREATPPLVFHTYQSYLKVREATPPLVFHTCQNYLKVREATPPLVFHTCQNYLKSTRDILDRDLQFADTAGIGFGAKLVRGAYMTKERKLAATCSYPDPVQDSYDDTSRAYDAAVTTLLTKIAAKPRQYRVIVASHNEGSVLATVRGIQQLGIDPSAGGVFFGQIMGMCDHISCNLAQNGFLARKSIVYGSVADTLPYLSRRAQENKAVIQGARRERGLLRAELRHRFSLGTL
ncbi:LOW QUALITY PROTEIN: hydroxyproline dehydrogenase-like [Babylonia areolata]|uniref:LOW QUALITY PROTEIN: hydroxyproline dehydrogenase-like n=1 Tax=Babylonia areolata TaxID=304850 RepID=UPI003FD18651